MITKKGEARVKFVLIGGKIKALVRFEDDRGCVVVRPSWGERRISFTSGEYGLYDYVVSPGILEEMLTINGIDVFNGITYENEEPLEWYEFEAGNTTVKTRNISRSPKFVHKWMNFDCPELYKRTTNCAKNFTSTFGLTCPIFTNVLIRYTGTGFFISSDITDEELSGLIQHTGNGLVNKALVQKLQLNNNPKTIEQLAAAFS